MADMQELANDGAASRFFFQKCAAVCMTSRPPPLCFLYKACFDSKVLVAIFSRFRQSPFFLAM